MHGARAGAWLLQRVRYALHNETCHDLALFLNGIPVATEELNNDTIQVLHNPGLPPRMLELLLGSFNLWEGLKERAKAA